MPVADVRFKLLYAQRIMPSDRMVFILNNEDLALIWINAPSLSLKVFNRWQRNDKLSLQNTNKAGPDSQGLLLLRSSIWENY